MPSIKPSEVSVGNVSGARGRTFAWFAVVLFVVGGLLSLFSSSLRAEEKEAAKEKETGAAEGGGKEDDSPASKDHQEFLKKTGKLGVLGLRIEEANKRFKAFIQEKTEAKTQEQKQAVIKEMVQLVSERNKDVDEYNKIKDELTYRFPNQGDQQARRYQTQSKRTVEEMESTGGLDEQLTYTKKLVERKYAPFMVEEHAKKPIQQVERPQDEEKTPRLRLEK